MFSSLEVKLDKRSESFPDQSLRLLFLINNTHFIWRQLVTMSASAFSNILFFCERALAKIEDYVQKYLQVSWEPVLSCLYNHAPHWFRKNSALPKFESEFQKTYTAQKLWKVPDPELRTRLRKAIVKKVVSGFTKYLEDNNITNPRITPQEGRRAGTDAPSTNDRVVTATNIPLKRYKIHMVLLEFLRLFWNQQLKECLLVPSTLYQHK